MKKLLILALCVFLISCNNSEEKKSNHTKSPKYVYFWLGGYHLKLECVANVDATKMKYNNAVQRVPIKSLTKEKIKEERFCAKCVSDKDFDKLLKAAKDDPNRSPYEFDDDDEYYDDAEVVEAEEVESEEEEAEEDDDE